MGLAFVNTYTGVVCQKMCLIWSIQYYMYVLVSLNTTSRPRIKVALLINLLLNRLTDKSAHVRNGNEKTCCDFAVVKNRA